jgi:hypothetical protein
MAQNTVNPYSVLGSQYVSGLASIIGSLPGSPAISDLVTAVYNYIITTFYGGTPPPLQIITELQSISYHTINSYVNSLVPKGSAMFTPSQYPVINMLIGKSVTKNLPIYLTDWITDVEDNITKTELKVDEQRPLLMATAIGELAVGYWTLATQAGGSSPWAPYFILNNSDYNSIPYWVEASMHGALAGYGANIQGLIEPTDHRYTTTMLSALIGALTIAAGKVIFGWIPRITKKLTLNVQTVSNLNNLQVGTVVFGKIGQAYQKKRNKNAPEDSNTIGLCCATADPNYPTCQVSCYIAESICDRCAVSEACGGGGPTPLGNCTGQNGCVSNNNSYCISCNEPGGGEPCGMSAFYALSCNVPCSTNCYAYNVGNP